MLIWISQSNSWHVTSGDTCPQLLVVAHCAEECYEFLVMYIIWLAALLTGHIQG